MIDYLKGSIFKFELNFEKALENTREWYHDDSYREKQLCV